MLFLYPIVGLLALLYFAKAVLRRQRHARLAAEWGCQPPAVRKSRLPLGLDFLPGVLEADRNHNIPNYLASICRDMGVYTWSQNTAGTQFLQTHEPENVKAVSGTRFGDFEHSKLRATILYDFIGSGIFTENGKAWEHSRALLRPQFTRDNIVDFAMQERHLQNVMRHLTVGSDGWTQQMDLSPIFYRLTLDTSTEFLFGQSVNSQMTTLPDLEKGSLATDTNLDWSKFGAAFDHCTMVSGTKFRKQTLHWTHNPSGYQSSLKEVHRFADHFVQRALEARANSEKHLEGGKHKYVFADELTEATQDPKELRDNLLQIMLAGRDTTAGLLGWVFYLLASNPEIYQKLRQSVLDDFGPYDEPRNMDFAGLKGCTYLRNVMTETLRLFPIVPINFREAVKDTVLPVGGGPDQTSPAFVPKGTVVSWNIHVIHRREDLYGPDAAAFNPDRWSGRKLGWEFQGFG